MSINNDAADSEIHHHQARMPALEETTTGSDGATTMVRRGLDVAGPLEPGEENPVLPPLPATD